MKKYELTGETKEWFGHTLHRIRALVAIERHKVSAGDLGGWIESENNLAHDGAAWVYGDAWVYGNARVFGDAQVYGDAWEKSPLYIQGTNYAAYMFTAEKFAVGCQHYTFAGWNRFWRKIAERYNFTEAEQREYIAYFNLACDRYGKEEYKISFDDDSGNAEVDE